MLFAQLAFADVADEFGALAPCWLAGEIASRADFWRGPPWVSLGFRLMWPFILFDLLLNNQTFDRILPMRWEHLLEVGQRLDRLGSSSAAAGSTAPPRLDRLRLRGEVLKIDQNRILRVQLRSIVDEPVPVLVYLDLAFVFVHSWVVFQSLQSFNDFNTALAVRFGATEYELVSLRLLRQLFLPVLGVFGSDAGVEDLALETLDHSVERRVLDILPCHHVVQDVEHGLTEDGLVHDREVVRVLERIRALYHSAVKHAPHERSHLSRVADDLFLEQEIVEKAPRDELGVVLIDSGPYLLASLD